MLALVDSGADVSILNLAIAEILVGKWGVVHGEMGSGPIFDQKLCCSLYMKLQHKK